MSIEIVNDNLISLWCWDKEKRILSDARSGHVAIGANGFIWGFYPTIDVEKPQYVPGELRKETECESADGYLLKYIDRPDKAYRKKQITDADNGLLRSENLPLPTAHSFSLSLSSASIKKLVDILHSVQADPPDYHIHENNCVKVTVTILEAAEIVKKGEFDPIKESRAPWYFLAKAKRLYEESDLVNDYRTKGIAWIDDDYCWINDN